MDTIEGLKGKWSACTNGGRGDMDAKDLANVFKKRVKSKFNSSMQYFWASFALQILVYAMLAHIVLKYWLEPGYMVYAVCGIVLYIPFTIVLMKKFKSIAIARPESHTTASLYQYARFHYTQLASFYKFKKRYEIMLIPLSVAIGTILTFNLFVPGGVGQYINGAIITFVLSLASCGYAIVRENRRSFEQPLRELEGILKEFETAETKPG